MPFWLEIGIVAGLLVWGFRNSVWIGELEAKLARLEKRLTDLEEELGLD